jgi:hypothetical protein
MSDQKLTEIIVDKFDGGISDDPREQVKNKFVLSKHFDIYSSPQRLSPFRSSELDSNDGSTSTGMLQYNVRDFWFSSISQRLYGLGNQASFGRPKIFFKSLANIPSGNWTLPATAEGSNTLVRGSFIEWAGSMWMFSSTNRISSWAIDSTFTDNAIVTTGVGGVCPPIISPFDNCMYMFYSNKVVRVDSSGSGTDGVVPLPVGYTCMSSCLYGSSYIAIGMSSASSDYGRSLLVLWDPTLANFSQVIDLGDGIIKSISNVEGNIIVVLDIGLSSTLSLTFGKLSIKAWAGGAVQVLKEIQQSASGGIRLSNQKAIKNGKLYFPAAFKYDGATQTGLWGFGRKNSNSPFSLSLAYNEENIQENGNDGIGGFGVAGDYFFLTNVSDGSIYKTDDVANFTFTSVYESQKFNGGSIGIRKQLASIFATYAPLPSAGQVVLKYKKDDDTSYTTLFTETTDNQVRTELGVGSAVTLPEFKEIQFRIESTGGAEITSFGFRFYPKQGATNRQ